MLCVVCVREVSVIGVCEEGVWCVRERVVCVCVREESVVCGWCVCLCVCVCSVRVSVSSGVRV